MKYKKNKIWLADPVAHDFPAALDYLELVMPPGSAQVKVNELKECRTILKKAKDILRASGLPLLPKDNIHVQANIKKVKSGKKLSPVLLVRGLNNKLIIADGYHRVCSVYYLSEDLDVPCRLS